MNNDTIMEIVDCGCIGSAQQFDMVIQSNPGTKEAIVAEVPEITHWWLLLKQDATHVFYFGTPDSLEKWRKK